MSRRLVVLGAAGSEPAWLRQLLSQIRPSPRYTGRIDGHADCEGLVVLDDGGIAGAEALQSALALREDHPEVPLTVVRNIGRHCTASEAMTRGLFDADEADSGRIGEARMRSLFGARPPELEVRITPGAIQFEYSGE